MREGGRVRERELTFCLKSTSFRISFSSCIIWNSDRSIYVQYIIFIFRFPFFCFATFLHGLCELLWLIYLALYSVLNKKEKKNNGKKLFCVAFFVSRSLSPSASLDHIFFPSICSVQHIHVGYLSWLYCAISFVLNTCSNSFLSIVLHRHR